MTRIDHSQNLIHFTKGYNFGNIDYEKSYVIFKNILKTKSLKGGKGMILGSHKCVCFTEAPLNCLSLNKQLNLKYFSRYSPFGFQFSKKTIFENDGRPVIYSKKEEYEMEKNNPYINWRYVTYDFDKQIDFTWEREWRIKTNSFNFNENDVKLIFPNMKWIERFIKEHEEEYHKSLDNDCEECFCTRNALIYTYDEFIEKCETISGDCLTQDHFPWILISLEDDKC